MCDAPPAFATIFAEEEIACRIDCESLDSIRNGRYCEPLAWQRSPGAFNPGSSAGIENTGRDNCVLGLNDGRRACNVNSLVCAVWNIVLTGLAQRVRGRGRLREQLILRLQSGRLPLIGEQAVFPFLRWGCLRNGGADDTTSRLWSGGQGIN